MHDDNTDRSEANAGQQWNKLLAKKKKNHWEVNNVSEEEEVAK